MLRSPVEPTVKLSHSPLPHHAPNGHFAKWPREFGDWLRPAVHAKPTDNAFAESLNGKVRAECLNTARFLSLDDARRKYETWRGDYDEGRPHSSIGNKRPVELMNGAGPYGPPGA